MSWLAGWQRLTMSGGVRDVYDRSGFQHPKKEPLPRIPEACLFGTLSVALGAKQEEPGLFGMGECCQHLRL
jgi:hypothetical protein